MRQQQQQSPTPTTTTTAAAIRSATTNRADGQLLNEIRSRGFAKPTPAALLLAPRSFSGRVPSGELQSVPLVVRRSFEEFDRLRAIRHSVLRAVSQAGVAKSPTTTTATTTKTAAAAAAAAAASTNDAAKLFALKPTRTNVSNKVVVGVDEAAKRLALRAIRLGEFKLRPAASATRVTNKVVVGVDEAAKRLSLRAIRLGEFKLKHVAEPRVRTQCVVGVKEAATRLALRSIRRGEFSLKPTQTRETHAVVVGGNAAKSSTPSTTTPTTPTPTPTTNKSTSSSTATTLRASSSELLLRVAEQMLALESREARLLIVDLVRLAATRGAN